MHKIWKIPECKYIEVDDKWLDGVNLNNAQEFELHGSKLKVIYTGGEGVWYNNIHGTWGDPTVFK